MFYSKIREQNKDHLREVLEALSIERMYVKFSKCNNWLRKAQILGNIVNDKGILVDLAKI